MNTDLNTQQIISVDNLASITAKDAENAKHVINNLCELCALCGEDVPTYPEVET